MASGDLRQKQPPSRKGKTASKDSPGESNIQSSLIKQISSIDSTEGAPTRIIRAVGADAAARQTVSDKIPAAEKTPHEAVEKQMPDYAVSVMPLISGVTVANECSHSDGTDVEDAWSLDGEAISSCGPAVASMRRPHARYDGLPRKKASPAWENEQARMYLIEGQQWMDDLADDLDSLHLEKQVLANIQGSMHNSTHSGRDEQGKLSEHQDNTGSPARNRHMISTDESKPSTIVDEQTGLERASVPHCPLKVKHEGMLSCAVGDEMELLGG